MKGAIHSRSQPKYKQFHHPSLLFTQLCLENQPKSKVLLPFVFWLTLITYKVMLISDAS